MFAPITEFDFFSKDRCETLLQKPYSELVHAPVGLVRQQMVRCGYDFDEYEVVSSVRNPWARVVSLYEYIKRKRDRFEVSFETFVRDQLPEWRSGLRKRWNTYEMFHDDGDRMVGRVFRLENLEDEIRDWIQVRGVDFEPDYGTRINVGPKVDYREYYTQPSRDFVGEFFRWDIREFGYSF